jgi:DNA-binding MarR family transcriptional regulator
MQDELDFLDLVILKKINAESTVEKFGPIINTSFFDAANLLGTMKIKGLVDIAPSVGGISRIVLTTFGEDVLRIAQEKAQGELEAIDEAILHSIASGNKELEKITESLNIRSSDLAYHLNKLVEQNFIDYEVRLAKVFFVLTEKGFNFVGFVKSSPTQQQLPHVQKEEDKELENKQLENKQQSETKKEEKATDKTESVKQKITLQMRLSKLQYYIFKYAYLIVIIFIIILLVFIFAQDKSAKFL